jgi:hypothetical protein
MVCICMLLLYCYMGDGIGKSNRMSSTRWYRLSSYSLGYRSLSSRYCTAKSPFREGRKRSTREDRCSMPCTWGAGHRRTLPHRTPWTDRTVVVISDKKRSCLGSTTVGGQRAMSHVHKSRSLSRQIAGRIASMAGGSSAAVPGLAARTATSGARCGAMNVGRRETTASPGSILWAPVQRM